MLPSTPISDDPYAYIGLIKNSDASFSRLPEFHVPTTPPCSDLPTPILTKDVPINPLNHTWARLYLPRRESSSSSSAAAAAKLPLIIFYHGGGFVMASAASTLFQNFCCTVALRLPALLLSVEYRLAPEHRLPAAYDDGVEALRWARSTAADDWLTEHADLSNCYVMGNSAGGNLALHVALRAAPIADELAPMEIRGLILHQPFFGGVEKTPSEIRMADDKVIPPFIADVIWDLALPIGANRDHEYSNPMKLLEAAAESEGLRWKVLVTGYGGDPLIDRQVEAVKKLREKGVVVMEDFREGGAMELSSLRIPMQLPHNKRVTTERERNIRETIDVKHLNLKEVEFVGYSGVITQLELLMHFVDNAVALQSIIVDPRSFKLSLRHPWRRIPLHEFDDEMFARARAEDQLKCIVPFKIALKIL